MENSTNYKECLTSDARDDIVKIKRYILNTFRSIVHISCFL